MEILPENQNNSNIFTSNINVQDMFHAELDNISASSEALNNITTDHIREAVSILQQYKNGKANLEQRIITNEEWYRLQHWSKERNAKEGAQTKRATGWLFNSIDNKHADFMDNFPGLTVLPREKADEAAAQDLSDIIPAVLERNHFKDVYSSVCTYKLKNGTGIYGVYWDPTKENGVGDISVQLVDALNLFWEPGITDIQRSENVFFVELVNNHTLKAVYPDVDLNKLGGESFTVAKYLYNENVDTSGKSSVVSWYYKKSMGGKTVLHYCRFVNDIILFASENDSRYADTGWYAHGMYPFVFDTLYEDVGTPFGFGLIDVNKEAQEDIDEMSSLILRNAKAALRRRYFISASSNVNQKEYADLDKDFVTVQGDVDDSRVKEISVSTLPGTYVEVLNNKIQELKEISSNRDVTAGGTSSAVTAASAIAALQESGNKTSRAMISKTYSAFRKVCELIIELMRQFYDVPRTFRIIGEGGETRFQSFSNTYLKGGQSSSEFGVTFAGKEPVFDLSVQIYKQNPWSKAAQNQDAISFYNMGLFNPNNDVQAMACMQMLDFENKDKVLRTIQQNGVMSKMLPVMLQAVQIVDSMQGTNNAEMFAQQLGMSLPQTTLQDGQPGTGNELAMAEGENRTLVDKAKARTAATTQARA